MKNSNATRNALPFIAGALAFLFTSIPLSLGAELVAGMEVAASDAQRDRAFADPQVQGYRGDARITDSIKSALADNDGLSESAKNVKVTTQHGNVFLRGTVASADEKAKVEKIVKGTPKVGLVENNLKIRQ